jgi:hypothetical protein
LKSEITEMKNSLEGLSNRFELAKEESMNLEMDQLKVSGLKTKMKIRITENGQRPMRHRKTKQHMHNGRNRRRGERKRQNIHLKK